MADITVSELKAASKIIEANPGMGRVRLAEKLGIGDRRAQTILAKLRPLPADAEVDPVKQRGLEIDNQELRKQLRGALDNKVFNGRYQQFIADVASRPVIVPEWVTKAPKKGNRMVMPTAVFSDWHLDEQVFPEQIQHLNGYNREVAGKRLNNFFNNVPDICFDFLSGFNYGGLVMPWLGDTFTGNIHEELRNTNVAVMPESLMYWVGPVVAGLKHLADAFGSVYVPVVVGNHGRLTMKPTAKMRATDNFDWLFAQIVARELSGDKRFTFAVSPAADFIYSVYNTTFLATHGDQAKGGSGIAAQWSPLMLMAVRKLKRMRFDRMICGHWHKLGQFQKIRCNGSGKGYDEYAFINNFEWEPPQQDLFLVDPIRGIKCDFPVHVASKDEPWGPRLPKDSGAPFGVMA